MARHNRQPAARLSMAEIERRLSVFGTVRTTNLPVATGHPRRKPSNRKRGA